MKRLLFFLVMFLFINTTRADNDVLESHYQYDALNRLTNVWWSNGYRETYAYDANGNRIRHSGFGPVEIGTINNITSLVGEKIKVPFTVRHQLIPISNILVTAMSSNPALLNTNNISIARSGTNMVMTIEPGSSPVGNTLISVVASDGFVFRTNSFVLNILPKN